MTPSPGTLNLPSDPPGRPGRLVRRSVAAAGVCAGALFAVIAVNSAHWMGATFPGFFVLPNRVVPSAALSSWGPEAPRLFQHQVLAVDDVPVSTADAVYDAVAQHPPGTPVRYTLRAPDGAMTHEVVRSRRLSTIDWLLIFGAYLLTAVSFIGTALVVLWLRPNGGATAGLVSASLGLGLFALTAADLYGPSWFVRLHVLAEALFPAGFLHLALVFPTVRAPAVRRPLLMGAYLSLLLFALVYECVLYWPSAYTLAHLVASGAHGLCGAAILTVVGYDWLTTTSALTRWRTAVVGAGTVTAFVGPMVVMGSSAMLGGGVAVNGAALTAFIFPVSLLYAILRRDLFDSAIFNPSAAASGADTPVVALRVAKTLQASIERLNARCGGWLLHAGVTAAGVLAAALIGVVAFNSASWVGTTFPGFLVMENRVIPSVALPDWAIDTTRLFQHEIVAVDGTKVESARAVYERARRQPPGTPTSYTLRGPDGLVISETVPSRCFSESDYVSLFGAFLLTGAAFLLAGLVAIALCARSAAAWGFLSTGVVGGVFVLTAVDLYTPHWFFRLHVIAEALVPASLVHLALVFPSNRLRRGLPLLLGTYSACLVLAGVYELALYSPVAYSAVHLTASTAQALGGLTLIWTIIYDLLTTRSVLVRRRILIAAIGTLAAFAVPTVLMGASGVLDGRVPVNGAALTGFFFPLSFAYAVVKRDLLKVDVFLARAVALLIALGTTTSAAVLHGLFNAGGRAQ